MLSTLKRKRSSAEPEKPRKRVPSPPFIGERPIITMYLSWDGQKEIRLRALVDAGSTNFILSNRIFDKYHPQYVKRDRPVRVDNAEGKSISSAGERYTYPLTIRHEDHYNKEKFEISPMESSIDIILPFWYTAVHRPSGFFDNDIHFDSDRCKENCTKKKCDSFEISYDTSILKLGYDSSEVGIIGMVHYDAGKAEVDWQLKFLRNTRNFRACLAHRLPLSYHRILHSIMP